MNKTYKIVKLGSDNKARSTGWTGMDADSAADVRNHLRGELPTGSSTRYEVRAN